MNAFRLLLAGVTVFALTVSVRAEKKDEKPDNAKLIVGIWEVTKADPGTVGAKAVIEFTKEGKIKVEDGDRKLEGTYKIEGDKFTFAIKIDGEERKKTITIKKISDKELSTTDDQGKKVEFKKK